MADVRQVQQVQQVQQWNALELEFHARRDYEDPYQTLWMTVAFRSPEGTIKSVDAFYDGERCWRARFQPWQTGEWEWTSSCSVPDDPGLDEVRGRFQCVPYEGDNPLYVHGHIALGTNRRHFAHADGTPLFWLADTAWNGVLRSRPDDWDTYLRTRRDQGFTAIQFVSTTWRGCSEKTLGASAFSHDRETLQIHPEFLRNLEPKIRRINDHGMLACPVILWAFDEGDPGDLLEETDAARFGRYLVSRWGAYHVAWMLAGDGRYLDAQAARWRRIGRGVFHGRHEQLVTMHPCGQISVAHEFRNEAWFDFIGYQSGHGGTDGEVRWLTQGPPAQDWKHTPPMPAINLEPNYELHPAYEQAARHHTDYEVRRAAWWSCLVMPTAGVSYGTNAIWVWPTGRPGPAEGHDRLNQLGLTPPWNEGLQLPGARCMTLLRQFFESIEWWRLVPNPRLLTHQPGAKDPFRFIAAAGTDDDRLAVFYLPRGGEVNVYLHHMPASAVARWFNPRDGEWIDADAPGGAKSQYTAPDDNDWVLLIRASDD